jgi:hypothetical protein
LEEGKPVEDTSTSKDPGVAPSYRNIPFPISGDTVTRTPFTTFEAPQNLSSRQAEAVLANFLRDCVGAATRSYQLAVEQVLSRNSFTDLERKRIEIVELQAAIELAACSTPLTVGAHQTLVELDIVPLIPLASVNPKLRLRHVSEIETHTTCLPAELTSQREDHQESDLQSLSSRPVEKETREAPPGGL